MNLKNKKLIFSISLFSCLIYYLIFSIPENLHDDHGIMIIAGLQVSKGLFPGINYTYPHGVIPPIILGFFFKLFNYFNIGWQFPYFLISALLFIFFVFILVKLINNIFEISQFHSSLIALLFVFYCLNPWGGIYFDYISIRGVKKINSLKYRIPGDMSSSAFFIVLTILSKKSKILIKNVNINPSRIGVINIL